MTSAELSGLNAGYVAQMFEAYLDAPASVPDEWRRLFENDPGAFAGTLPGLAGLLREAEGNGAELADREATGAAGATAGPAPVVETVAPVAEPVADGAAPGDEAVPEAPPPDGTPSRRDAPRRRRGGDGARQGLPHARPPCGAARSARLRADGRPGTRRVAARPLADARAAGAHPGLRPPSLRRRERRWPSAAEAPSRLHRLDRVRDRAHLRSCRARLAAPGDRVGPLPAAARARGAARASCTASPGGGLRAVPAPRRSWARSSSRSRASTTLVPMLDEAIALAAAGGAHEVVIGMAHRGRLNALVHTVGRSYQSILREFEGERSIDALVVDPEGGTGDVKYHLPASGTRVTRVRRDRRHDRPRTRATSRRSTRSSRAGPAPSRPTARAAPASTTRPSRCRC